MSAPSGDNGCVSDYPCPSTLHQTRTLTRIPSSHHHSHLGSRPESDECPSTNGSSGHQLSHAIATTPTAATGITSTVTPINMATSSSSSLSALSPSHDLHSTETRGQMFYQSSYASHIDSQFNHDVLLGRNASRDHRLDKPGTGQPLSVLPFTFQIKQENNLSPPVRSLSVHSLPGSLVSQYQLGSTSSTHSGPDPFVVNKREMCGDSDLVRQDATHIDDSELARLSYVSGNGSSVSQSPHTMGYVTCSSIDPHRSAVLPQSHLIGSCLRLDSSSSHVSLFPGHTATLSPLPLTIATTATGTNCTTQGPSGATQRNPMGLHVDLHSGAHVHLDSPGSGQHLTPFDTGEHGFTLLPPFSMSTCEITNKRASSHGNGVCDLSAAPLVNLSVGLSPRSKARRYSYPYEPMGLGKSSLQLAPGLDHRQANHNCPSPGLFRMINQQHQNNNNNANNYHMVGLIPSSTSDTDLTPLGMNGSGGGGAGGNGARTLSTPMSSCGGEDVHQSGALGGDHGLDQKPYLPLVGDITLPGFNSPESAFYQYQHRMEGQRCQVCGELAAGFHHGAYVCEACKKFFMRHSLTDTKPTNVCPTGGNCVVAKGSRGKCQICRYRKCLYVGMKMKDPETQPELDISNIPCRVCGGRSSGFHFGALTCEGCKGFFRRTEGSASSLVCVGGQNACTITPRSRNACKSCRFRRCIAAGMSKKGSRIGRQPNAVKFHCAIEIRQLRSIRNNFPSSSSSDHLSMSNVGPMASNPSVYTPFGVDVGQTMDVTTMGPGSSSHNRSDVESPKYSPDTLTPTYSNKQRDPNLWLNDQKPPLSLLLFLPRSSDPIDVTSSCGGSVSGIGGGYPGGEECVKPSPHYSPPSTYHPAGPGNVSDRLGLDSVCLRPSTMTVSSMGPGSTNTVTIGQSNRRNHLDSDDDDEEEEEEGEEDDENSAKPEFRLSSEDDRRLVSPKDDERRSLPSLRDSDKSLDPYQTSVSLALHSILAPFGYLGRVHQPASAELSGESHIPDDGITRGLQDNGNRNDLVDECLGTSVEHSSAAAAASTVALITELAQRLAEDERAGLMDEAEPDDVSTSCPPSQEAVLRFTEGMRTATEFLRLPNTYFKTRFRMSSIPLDQHEKDVQVWSHMMNHFHMHAQQIVQFAKLVPGFNHLGITARSNLVRGAMYPVVLFLLSRDYRPDTDEYNYFDFTPEERSTIMHHFPSFIRFTQHLRMAGRLLHYLALSLPELSLLCAVEIVRNYKVLDEPTRSSTKELYLLAHHSLQMCMTRRSESSCDGQHRWAQLVALSKMVQAMSREHHVILGNLKSSRPDLHFPELYVEMFRLADGASALVSASAKAVTLACSSAFQSLAPLKLSLCTMSMETNSTTSAPTYHDSGGDSISAGAGLSAPPLPTEAGELTASGHGFLPYTDRWDAGRLALAVPAAMAAVAAAAAEASSLSHTTQQQQQHQLQLTSSVAPIPTGYHQSQGQLDSSGSTTTALLPRSDMITGVAYPSQRHPPTSAYFTGAAQSFFFPPQTHHPPAS